MAPHRTAHKPPVREWDEMFSGEQELPRLNGKPSIRSLVEADLKAREAKGVRKYGVPLQAGNGRDALRDLYEELLDAAMYCRQAIAERDER